MITEEHGNLLQAPTECLVNTVNAKGIMGKGIALQFKRAYPENFKAYERACKAGDVAIGKMHVFPVGAMTNPRYIINFPTKNHWRSNSRIEDIEAGLDDLVKVIENLGINSIAVPPLGCGNGGLDWADVHPLIVRTFEERLPWVDVYLYRPEGAPSAQEMPVRTNRPAMTRKRAAQLLAYARYVSLSAMAGHAIDGEFSIVEAQKVSYFLQQAGWPSAFEFNPSHFGPYAQTVDQWLSHVEGHYMTGYGDGTSGSQAVLRIDSASLREASEVMEGDTEFFATLDKFEEIVYGFEFPYGVELLSTVHYLVASEPECGRSLDDLITAIGAWSHRKSRLFQPRQAVVALEHLREVGAIPAA